MTQPTRIFKQSLAMALATSCLAVAVPLAQAADKVKVGFVSTLSGPAAALGVDIRDGFQLAVKLNGGKLGGLPAEVLIGDDQFKPDVAKQLSESNVKRDKVDFMTGVVFSNIMLAGAARGAGQQHLLHQPERGAVVDRRQGLQPVVLRGVLAERRLPRGRRPARQQARPQVGVPAGAQLPGRQGFAGRLQALLQGPGGRRELHQARPARLRRRAGRDARRQAAGGVHLPARRHGHQLHQAVRRCRPVQGHDAAAARLRRRPGRDQAGGRADAGPVQHRALGARLR